MGLISRRLYEFFDDVMDIVRRRSSPPATARLDMDLSVETTADIQLGLETEVRFELG